MLKKLKDELSRSPKFQELRNAAGALGAGEGLAVRGMAGSLLAFAAGALFESSGRPVLLVGADEDASEKLRDDCALLLGEARVRHFGARPSHPAQSLDMSSSIAQIEALKTLAAGTTVLTVASPHSIGEGVPPPAAFRKTVIEIARTAEIDFQKLLAQLDELGFERKDFVGAYGEYAVRGGIVDIFPFVGEHPVRVEFWGDTVESVREFDVLSQRSIREMPSASIVPDLAAAPEGAEPAPPTGSLFDYLAPGTIVILDDPARIEKEIDELLKEGASGLQPYADVIARVRRFAFIESLGIVPSGTSAPRIDMGAQAQPAFNGSVAVVLRNIQKLLLEGYRIILASDTKQEADRLRELLEETVRLPHGGEEEEPAAPETAAAPEFLTETVHAGFLFPEARIALFTEHEVFNRLRRRGGGKRRRFKGISSKELQQLRRGDYVVHVDYGIGTFAGLTKLSVAGVEQEALKLLFLENDVLYVNLNFVNRVQKYSSQEGHVPKLTRLGTGEWDRVKDRAKKRIKDLARDIIKLYARRKQEPGFAFGADTHWQRELEASFMYEDTPDQARATLEVKADMESPSPMDRLVCGDVGFGKTEVAVRAAFKAVMDGKQVAILVPTTILAVQHYNTFHDRLSRYTTRIEHLTRFKSAKDQKKTVEALKRGTVDIIIGTHRILSKDIAFRDLGLLIIDEEHRFGVAAKEKLRQLKANVDTLAMTATPIPRTLHFSLIGARDLSLITTPPRNRMPIVTEIIPADATGRQTHWKLIREAVMKELYRGGQIYFVHDRVHNIDAIAEQVRKHIPEAKVHVAHGQMSGHQLERTMLDFLEKKYDVLVCTKIIESGVDIPSVNTIIINRADMFGLAELYQLRGRVGRSNVQAYSYLLTPPLGVMPKQSLRRLQVIEEFTDLGSGFNLAMRDLEIRGAGNLLGGEQSGYIMDMGFEMYERIVREAVEELRHDEFQQLFEKQGAPALPAAGEAVIESDIQSLIPDVYVESDAERLDIYRRIYGTAAIEDLTALQLELRDRFGEYPEEVSHLFALVGLRLRAAAIRAQKVALRGGALRVTLPPPSDGAFYGESGDSDAPFQRIMKNMAGAKSRRVQLKQEGDALILVFALDAGAAPGDRMEEARLKLEELVGWANEG
jgi:transcription-repair coupling factor (superfamily II helicase)